MIYRTRIIAGNWKMFKSPAEGSALAREIVAAFGDSLATEVVLCPSLVTLPAVAEVLLGTPIGVGAQCMHWEESGAYTGEVSAPMLSGWCTHIIVGHSERRQYCGETDEIVNRKVKAALKHDLAPIICVGENLIENKAGRTGEVVERQVRAAYEDVTAEQAQKTIIAYEPIWAIGSGRASTGAEANSVCGLNVRGVLTNIFGESVSQKIRVQYGGSVKPGNIAEFMSQPDIDGALVGGASLHAADFVSIVKNAA